MRFFQRLSAALFILCLIGLSLAWTALAEESEDAIVSPTRNPNAVKYDDTKPWDLLPEHLVAHAFILMEADSGEILFEQNIDDIMYPASTTKIMTALLALQLCDLSELVTISEFAVDLPADTSKVPFRAGEVVTMRDALYGLMLRSGNEAATAIAEHISGSQESFARLMNQTAAMLGMENTNFVNAHGLHDPNHYTTARDLAILTQEAMRNSMFRLIVGTHEYTLAGTELNPARKIYNGNLMLDPNSKDYYYPYGTGAKTGSHSQAAYNLVGTAEKSGVAMIAVALYTGKYSRWPDVRWMLEYGFTLYKSVTPQEIYRKEPMELQVTGFSLEDSNLGILPLDIRAVDSSRVVRITGRVDTVDLLVENYRSYTSIEWVREARAPINQGDVMGILTFYPGEDEDPAEYQLIASRSIAMRLNAPPTLDEIEQQVAEDPWPFPPFSWDWAAPPLVFLAFGLLLLRSFWRLYWRRRKQSKRVPKPRRRYLR